MQHQAAPHEPPDRPAVAAAVGGRRPFLIGIGGSGMSALARLLAAEGMPVRGSDSTESPATRALQAAGIPVDPRQVAESLDESADLVIASAAIRPDHAQVVEAVRRGITVLTYAEALGRCMSVRTGVCVAGTHGKSTTTAMLGCALTDAGLDPSVIVGATCGQLASGCVVPHDAPPHPPMPSTQLDRERGFRLGSARVPGGAFAGRPGLLIAEACEYNRSFHHHRPTLATIANVEADHLDIYGSLDAVIEAFAGFAALIPPAAQGGRLIIGHDGAHRRQITAGLACRVDTIGFAPQADWRVDLDRASGLIRLQGPDGHHAAWTLAMPGEHNAMNSAVAAAAAIAAGADPPAVARSLSAFAGLDRRMQFLGERAAPGGAVRVYDDYGHHPTEVDATLRALRLHEAPERRGGRLIVVFQPHQHSRTRFLLEEFATSFSQADIVIVPHIYFVRDSEIEKQRVSSADLVDRLRRRGVRAMHLYPFEAIVEQLENLCRGGDVLVVMGAGPVWQVAEGYTRAAGPAPSPEPPTPTPTPHTHQDLSTLTPPANAPAKAPAVHAGPSFLTDAPIPTWFGVGGRADRLVKPASVDELRRLLADHPGALILGDGANLLVDDDGVPGPVIDLTEPAFRESSIDPDALTMTVGAGARLPGVIGRAVRAGLGGLETLAGIPASIGGAVVMNAGGRFGSIGDRVLEVEALTRAGEPVRLGRGAIGFAYRRSGLEGLVITRVRFSLTRADPDELRVHHRACQAYKEQSQPLGERSAGCCFKNPILTADLPGIGAAGDRVSAGLLIDRAGAKGLRIGSARVSPLHANFITADRGGRAADAVALMNELARRVLDSFGVALQREVVVWSRGLGP